MAAKIAIIEDDLAILKMYALKLSASNYEVETAVNGSAGLELLKNYKPDLILLDLMMPHMNGAELLEEYRKMPKGKKTKVVILTNIGKDEAPKNLHKLGVSDYIIKADHTPAQVIEVVERVLKER